MRAAGAAVQGEMMQSFQPEYRSIDGLRSISVISIVIFHAIAMFLPTDKIYISIGFHWIGLIGFVYLFVLSGFLMTLSTKRMFLNSRFLVRKYIIFRAARILPAYILGLFIVWVLAYLSYYEYLNGLEKSYMGNYSLNLNNFIRDLTFTFNKNTPMQNINGPVWSLRLEIVCYIVLFLGAIAISENILVGVIATTINIILLIFSFIYLTDAWIGIFGFAVGFFIAQWPQKALKFTNFPLWKVTIFVGIIGYFFLSGAFYGNLETRHWSRQIYIAIMMLASISLIMPSDENLKKIQKWALPFEKSAAFSYTLYITHYPIFILLTGIFQKPDGLLGYGIYIIGMLAFTFAFSFLLAKVVEQRDTTRQWFDRIVPGRKVTSGRIAQ
jgi:peptidoglycan/LPS O-acetylase OafA/YrhL